MQTHLLQQQPSKDNAPAAPAAAVAIRTSVVPTPAATRAFYGVWLLALAVFASLFSYFLASYIARPHDSTTGLYLVLAFGILLGFTLLFFLLCRCARRGRLATLSHIQDQIDNGTALIDFVDDEAQWTAFIADEWGPTGRRVRQASWQMTIFVSLLFAGLGMVMIKWKATIHADELSWQDAALFGLPGFFLVGMLAGAILRLRIVVKRRLLQRETQPLVLTPGAAYFTGTLVRSLALPSSRGTCGGRTCGRCFATTRMRTSAISKVGGFHMLTIRYTIENSKRSATKVLRVPVSAKQLAEVDAKLRAWKSFYRYQGIVGLPAAVPAHDVADGAQSIDDAPVQEVVVVVA
eukprot:g1495.t1